jgi:hypothetical protein
MFLSVEEDESPHPSNIRLFCPRTEMAETNGGTKAIEKLRRIGHVPRLPRKEVKGN